jgi:hypothetical protein
MSYIVTKTITKPADVEWFIDYDPITWVKIDEWNKTITGLVSMHVETIDGNQVVFTLVFEDESKYQKYSADCRLNPDWVTRDNYNNENNIVTVVALPS